jgi:hypothetical protein
MQKFFSSQLIWFNAALANDVVGRAQLDFTKPNLVNHVFREQRGGP